MAGPIRDFIQTLQERQPVRNALRGVLGLPQRRSTTIDSFEEMAARDREMGGDISNPYPNARMAPRIASTATTGPSAAAGLPGPQAAPEAIAAPAPAVDPSQPYKGMGMMQAVVTPPSEALRRQQSRQVPVRAVSQAQPGPLNQDISTISNSGLSPEERAMASADRLYAEAQRTADPVRIKTLVRVAEAYEQRAAALRASRVGGEVVARAGLDAQRVADTNATTTDVAAQNALDLVAAEAKAQGEHAQLLNKLQKGTLSAATASADALSPLRDNPNLSITAYADQFAQLKRDQLLAAKVTDVDGPAQLEYSMRFDSGLADRLAQQTREGSLENFSSFFGSHSPAFGEVAYHYRKMLEQNPKSYDQLLAKVTALVAASAGREFVQKGLPQEKAMRYSQGVAADILGPRPDQTPWYERIYNTVLPK